MSVNRNLDLIPQEDEVKTSSELRLRVGIYARKSSIGNALKSTEEQIELIRSDVERGLIKSRRYPDAKLLIVEECILWDDAETGRVSRTKYEYAKQQISSRILDIWLIYDLSRATRDLGSMLDVYELLVYHGVEGISVSEGISTFDPNAKDFFTFKGYANEQQSRSISNHTQRGLRSRLEKGFSTGHVPWGYVTSPTQFSFAGGKERPSHYEISIDPIRAAIVLRIWTMYGENIGCDKIAETLNDEGISSERKNRTSVSTPCRWTHKKIWTILQQLKYTGDWRYRLHKTVRNPMTDKLEQVARPKSEHLVQQRDDLRIIPDEIAIKVTTRQTALEVDRRSAEGKQARIFGRDGHTPSDLFTGVAECGACGGNMIQTSGRHGGYLGCANAHRQMKDKCSNRKIVQIRWLEWHLMEELRIHLDSADTYQYIADRFNQEMNKKHNTAPKRIAALESQEKILHKNIGNYDKFIRSGNWSDTIAANLAEAERNLKTLIVALEHERASLGDQLYITPAAVRSQMIGIRELLNEKVAEANKIIKNLFPVKIKLVPPEDEPTNPYRAVGEMNIYSLVRVNTKVVSIPSLSQAGVSHSLNLAIASPFAAGLNKNS